jgi:hypothetical protein
LGTGATDRQFLITVQFGHLKKTLMHFFPNGNPPMRQIDHFFEGHAGRQPAKRPPTSPYLFVFELILEPADG